MLFKYKTVTYISLTLNVLLMWSYYGKLYYYHFFFRLQNDYIASTEILTMKMKFKY